MNPLYDAIRKINSPEFQEALKTTRLAQRVIWEIDQNFNTSMKKILRNTEIIQQQFSTFLPEIDKYQDAIKSIQRTYPNTEVFKRLIPEIEKYPIDFSNLFQSQSIVNNIFNNIDELKIDITPYENLPITEFIDTLKDKAPEEYLEALEKRYPNLSKAETNKLLVVKEATISVYIFIRKVIIFWFKTWTFLAFFFPSLSPAELFGYADLATVEYIKEQIAGCQNRKAEEILRNIIPHNQEQEPNDKDNCSKTIPEMKSFINQKGNASGTDGTTSDQNNEQNTIQTSRNKDERNSNLREIPKDEQTHN